MIKVSVKSTSSSFQSITEITNTPANVMDELGILAVGLVNFNGEMLSANQLNNTFESLGIVDGDEVTIWNIKKSDGATLN